MPFTKLSEHGLTPFERDGLEDEFQAREIVRDIRSGTPPM